MNSLERIRREVFGVRQSAFGAIAGASQTAVSRWESGESSPNLEQLGRIRSAAFDRGFGWDDALFFDVETPLPAQSGAADDVSACHAS